MSEHKKKYIAVINQEEVNDEVRNIAINYDPINRSGGQGFHLNEDGKLHIEDAQVIEAHKIIQNKIPNEAIKIIPLSSARGRLIHQYGQNGFSLYRLPRPKFNQVVGIIGRNGIGKSTAMKILAGELEPNLGDHEKTPDFSEVIGEFKGTEAQIFFEKLQQGEVRLSYKPQHVELIPKKFKGKVRTLLEKVDERNCLDEIAKELELEKLLDRKITQISGGELQRVAIAAAAMKDANLYLFDEPTSYLDVKQRVKVSKYLQSLKDEDTSIIVIEHDLIILDYMTDLIHIMYGEEEGYGVVSKTKTTKRGINTYLGGYITDENVQFRQGKIEFESKAPRDDKSLHVLTSWPSFGHDFEDFSLRIEEGTLYKGDVVGVLGENGIGKSTFAKIIAGEIKKDEWDKDDLKISYKPQYLESGKEPVALVLKDAAKHKTVFRPLNLDTLMTKTMDSLSGGQLQRVRIAEALSKEADLYVLDEPSAYLDVEARLTISKVIRNFMEDTQKTCLVIDHDLLFLDYISKSLMVFSGEPARRGVGVGPLEMEEGMNMFLKDLDITFRRDEANNRPRVNKEGSQKDKQQKANNNLYYTP